MGFSKFAPLALLISLSVAPVAASAAIVDFEDVVVAPASFVAGTTLSSGGFNFTQTAATTDVMFVIADPVNSCTPSCVDNGTQYLSTYNNDQTGPFEMIMSRADGAAFSLNSFTFGTMFIFTPNPQANLTLTGTLAGGGSVVQSFVFDNIADNFQLAILSAAFGNVTSILFSSDTVFPAYDNFDVSAVPLPGALPLFLAGIAGLSFGKRRRKKSAA